MRAIIYWVTSMTIAVLAAGAAEHQGKPGEVFLGFRKEAHLPLDEEPSRAILLGLGIMAVAFTYRHAWLNFKRKS